MPGSASLYHMHALLESDYAILSYIFHFFALCRCPKSRGVAQYSHLKYVPGCACFNGHSISHSLKPFNKCFRKVWFVNTDFLYKVLFMMKYTNIFRLVLRCLFVAGKENSTSFSTGLTGRSKNLDPTGNPTGFHL